MKNNNACSLIPLIYNSISIEDRHDDLANFLSKQERNMNESVI